MVNTTDPLNPANAATPAQMAAHTEQALLELVYVQTANDILGSAMTNLEGALNTTQNVLNILRALQNLHNDIDVKSASAFNFNFASPAGLQGLTTQRNTGASLTTNRQPLGGHGTAGGTGLTIDRTISHQLNSAAHLTTILNLKNITDYQKAYLSAASAYFSKAIDPFFVFASSTAAGYADFKARLTAIKARLQTEINTLGAQTSPSARADPTSLFGTLLHVFSSLPADMNDFKSVERWALDNFNVHGASGITSAGRIQNDLTAAITAAQSLNDTQKEKVRSYLFIFQEYYQSASAVLSAIAQIIQKMAQKISS